MKARQLAEQGHAVFRYAKHGSGTGVVVVEEEKTLAHPLFPRQQFIAAAAIKKMRELVPQAKGLALAGHSEGSVHGLILAQQPDLGIDSFISLSGPALRYMDLFMDKARLMAQQQGEIIDFGAFKVNAANYIEKLFHEKSFHLMCIFRASSIRADQARRWHSPAEKLERTRETNVR